MDDEQRAKFIDGISKLMEKDIEGLIYKEPKCDFEHIWNSAVDSCKQVLETYQEDEEIELNEEKLDEFVIPEHNSQIETGDSNSPDEADQLHDSGSDTQSKNSQIKKEIDKDYEK